MRAGLQVLLIARVSHSLVVNTRLGTPATHAPKAQRARGCSGVRMNITPIGPFCPFRSEACRLDGNVDTGMGSLTSKSTSFMADMARLQLESQMGTEPDPERVKSVAEDLAAALEDWEVLMSRLRLSSDFQSREYFKMTEAHLKKAGQQAESALRPV
jgi:hypothetical protein